MTNRASVIATLIAVCLIVVIGYANYEVAATGTSDFRKFQQSICAISAQQQKGSSSFVNLLEQLQTRAVQRERADLAAGSPREAAADSDIARLYQSVIDQYAAQGAHPRPSLSC